jgi:hypothetical protein
VNLDGKLKKLTLLLDGKTMKGKKSVFFGQLEIKNVYFLES